MLKLKDMKVQKKLLVSHGVIIIFSLIIAIAGNLGMMFLNNQSEHFVHTTMPDTVQIWEMRRNLMSEIAWEMMALSEPDPSVVQEYMAKAQKEIDANAGLLAKYDEDNKIDVTLLNELTSCIQAQEAPRKEFANLAQLDTEEGNQQAYHVMNQTLMPLLLQETDILKNITSMQNADNVKAVDQAASLYHILVFANIALMVASLAVALFFMKKLMDSILQPLGQIEDAAEKMAKAEFDAPLDFQSQDEFGRTCMALKECQTSLQLVIADECYLLNEMAEGNFNVRSSAPEKYVGELTSVLASVRKINRGLSDSLHLINQNVVQVAEGADQVSAGAQTLAQGATEQASAVEELSATIGEIRDDSSNNAKNSATALENSRQAGRFVAESAADVEEMVRAMSEITESSQEIGKIIATIENIAFQTNILALNAAVEAARAGAAGKGFAVVADEVRNLAAKSDEAAKATKELISGSIIAVQNGEKIVARVSKSLDATKEATKRSGADIELIAAAVDKEAQSLIQIADGIDQIASVVQTNSATSEESAAASAEVTQQAANVREILSRFTLSNSETVQSVSNTEKDLPTFAVETTEESTFPSFSKY